MIDKYTLIDQFSLENYVTAGALSEIFQVSTKTIRKAIQNLNKEIIPFGAEIIAKPNRGYRLIISDTSRFQSYLNQAEQSSDMDKDCYDLLESFLYTPGYIKLDDLSEQMCLSRTTLQKRMNQVKELISPYNIYFTSRPNYGTVLSGNELDIRRCAYEIIGLNKLRNNFNYNKQYSLFDGILSHVLQRNEISLAIADYHEILNRLLLSYHRWNVGYFIDLPDGYARWIRQLFLIGSERISCCQRSNREIIRRTVIEYSKNGSLLSCYVFP